MIGTAFPPRKAQAVPIVAPHPHPTPAVGTVLSRLRLRLIFGRMRQGPLMLERLRQVASVGPATAGRAARDMLGFVLRRIAEPLAALATLTIESANESA